MPPLTLKFCDGCLNTLAEKARHEIRASEPSVPGVDYDPSAWGPCDGCPQSANEALTR